MTNPGNILQCQPYNNRKIKERKKQLKEIRRIKELKLTKKLQKQFPGNKEI